MNPATSSSTLPPLPIPPLLSSAPLSRSVSYTSGVSSTPAYPPFYDFNLLQWCSLHGFEDFLPLLIDELGCSLTHVEDLFHITEADLLKPLPEGKSLKPIPRRKFLEYLKELREEYLIYHEKEKKKREFLHDYHLLYQAFQESQHYHQQQQLKSSEGEDGIIGRDRKRSGEAETEEENGDMEAAAGVGEEGKKAQRRRRPPRKTRKIEGEECKRIESEGENGSLLTEKDFQFAVKQLKKRFFSLFQVEEEGGGGERVEELKSPGLEISQLSAKVASLSHNLTQTSLIPQSYECIQTLLGHSDEVWCITQLTDGSLASSSRDTTVRICNLDTGALIHVLQGHQYAVYCVVQLSDGRIVTSGYDNQIKIWNPNTGVCMKSITGPRNLVCTILELRNEHLGALGITDHSGGEGSNYLMGCCGDGTLRVWNLTSGAILKTLRGHNGTVYIVIRLSDGRYASGSHDETAKLWDLTTETCLMTLTGHTGYIWVMIQLTDGRLVTGSSDNTARIWNLSTQQCERVLSVPNASICSLLQLPDGRLLTGCSDKRIRFWNVVTGECVKNISVHQAAVYAIIRLADGRLVTGSTDHTVKVWKPLS